MESNTVDVANDAMGMGYGSGMGQVEAATPATIGGGSYYYVPEPKTMDQPPITIDGAVTAKVVRVQLTGAPYEEVVAANDPDTGVITMRIGCQSHPIGRWRRIGARLIRNQYGATQVDRLAVALESVLARIEAEFAQQ